VKSEAQEISETVASWFHYKSLTGLNGLLKESSMAVPIAEYLASKHGREVESEKAHPLFNSGGQGRPKQIDFVRVKHGDRTWHSAYETKFKTRNFDLIIGDLCRLLCLAQAVDVGNPGRFLIYAVKLEGDGAILDNKFNPGGHNRISYFENILPRPNTVGKNKDCVFKINELHAKQRSSFRKFAKSHKVELPSSVRVKLSGSFESGGFSCAVWQIWAQKGSTLLNHKEILK